MTIVKELPPVKIIHRADTPFPEIYIDGNYIKGVVEYEVYPEDGYTEVKIRIATLDLNIITEQK